MSLFLIGLLVSVLSLKRAEPDSCHSEDITFELVTGFAYSDSEHILETKQGIVILEDCIRRCRNHYSCYAVNYETGLCVLFDTKPNVDTGIFTKSQFPVFSIFAQKVCVHNSRYCGRSWTYEIVQNHKLQVSQRHIERVSSRHECMELCLQEDSFICRSSNYNEESMLCAMNDKDRFTVNDADFLVEEENTYYLESNCVSDPNTLCGFIKVNGNILKTVDSVHQDVSNFEACRQLCLNTKDFRCHTFDFDMAGDNVCRLSHHATASLHHIDEPYLDLENVTTHQLASCFNVTIECRATDILARIKTNKVFNGKVYSKTRPNSCVTDVINSLEFDLRLGYNDLNCDVKQNALGRFGTEIIIQHHDHIVTNQDVGLSLRCSYNFQNNSIGHGVELEVTGNIETSNKEESSYIVSPRVTMRITDRFGEDINTAQVGDALSLRFDIIDRDSQYQIFVRELIAMDGIDTSEILLIDSLGCPTDPTIMGAISSLNDAKVVQAPFDAFKFPTSDIVQFKALVTPCLPACQPNYCDHPDYYGKVRKYESFGKRKKRDNFNKSRQNKKEDMLIEEIIHVTEKLFLRNSENRLDDASVLRIEKHLKEGIYCLNHTLFVMEATLFVSLQVVFAFLFIWYQKYKNKSNII